MDTGLSTNTTRQLTNLLSTYSTRTGQKPAATETENGYRRHFQIYRRNYPDCINVSETTQIQLTEYSPLEGQKPNRTCTTLHANESVARVYSLRSDLNLPLLLLGLNMDRVLPSLSCSISNNRKTRGEITNTTSRIYINIYQSGPDMHIYIFVCAPLRKSLGENSARESSTEVLD